jgi:TP901 family phage tail tape measure protein
MVTTVTIGLSVFGGDFVGATGDFNIKYKVWLDELQAQLRRAEEMARASTQRLNTFNIGGTNLNKQQVASLDQVNRKFALRTARLRETRMASAQASREAERLRRATERQSKTVSASAQSFRHLTLALRRMILWWSTAAVLLGAQRLGKQVLEVAGSFQMVVRELTVLGSEGEAIYRRLGMAAFDAAAATGRSFNEAADAMKAWVRQGFSALEVADLTRTTLIGLNLTELSSVEVVRTLTAQMRAFNIPASESITIIDQLLGVSREYAIETTQLAQGMRRFAAVSNEAGVSLQQQAGLMTAMMVRTQQAAQMVGRAGRTILTRMRRNAVQVIEEIAKIEVFTDKSRQTFRSMFDVLSDLADKWGDFTDAQKTAIAFQAAGLRQQEFFIALMEDFDVAQRAVIVALGSAGLAYKSNRLLVDTLQKAIAGLRTQWEKLLASQSGILSFFESLINGLRAMLRATANIPEGFVQIGAALTALGGIVLGVTFNPLIGGFIALTSAMTLFLSVAGKSAPPLADLAQLARETAQARLAEARSTEDLTRLYIKYFNELQKGADREALLEETRQALIKINPRLVDGAATLEETYESLTESIDTMSEATKDAERSFRGLSQAMLERTIVELKQDISDLIPDFQQLGSGIDARDTEQLREHAKTLRDDVGKGWQELITLQTAYARQTGVTTGKITQQTVQEAKRLNDLIETTDKLRKARDADREAETSPRRALLQQRLPGALAEEIEKRKQVNLTLNERALLVEKLVNQLDALADAEKRLAEFFEPTPTREGGKVEIGIDEEQVKEHTKQLEKQLDLRGKILEILALQDTLRAGGVTQLDDEATLSKRILDDIRQTLNATVSISKDQNRRVAASRLLATFADGEAKALETLKTILESMIAIQRKRRTDAEKMAADDRKAREEMIRQELRLAILRERNAKRALDNAIKARAEATRTSSGEIAAARQAFREKMGIFLREQNLLKQQRAEARRESDPVVRQQQLKVDTAEQEALAAFVDLQNAQIQAGIQLKQANAQLDRSRLQNAVDLSGTSADILTNLEAEVTKRKEALVLALGEGNSLDARVKKTEALIALEEALNKLAIAKGQIQEPIDAARQSALDAEFNASVQRTRLIQGEEAALERVIAREREKLNNMIEANTEEQETAEIIQQREVVNDRIAALALFRLGARIDGEKELDRLETQRQQNELQHEIVMAELEGGRLAGLEVELQFWHEKLSLAEQEVDTERRKALIKQAQNNIDATNNDMRRTERATELRWQQDLVRFAGQQLTAAFGGDFGIGGFVGGIAGTISSMLSETNPLLAVAISTMGGVLGNVFGEPADELSDSLDRNTTAIDRNTQTLQDVFAQRIGVPTNFALPASILMQGALPSGGGFSQQTNTITIQIDGRGQDTEQIVSQVEKSLARTFSINSRRGFGSNVYALG